MQQPVDQTSLWSLARLHSLYLTLVHIGRFDWPCHEFPYVYSHYTTDLLSKETYTHPTFFFSPLRLTTLASNARLSLLFRGYSKSQKELCTWCEAFFGLNSMFQGSMVRIFFCCPVSQGVHFYLQCQYFKWLHHKIMVLFSTVLLYLLEVIFI